MRGNHIRQSLGWLGRATGNRLSSSDWTKMGFGTHRKGCERHQMGQVRATMFWECPQNQDTSSNWIFPLKEPKAWPQSSAQCKPKGTKWKEWRDFLQQHTLNVTMLRSALQDAWIWPHPSTQVQPQHLPAALVRAVQFITNSLLKAMSIEHPPCPRAVQIHLKNQACSLNLIFHNKNATT